MGKGLNDIAARARTQKESGGSGQGRNNKKVRRESSEKAMRTKGVITNPGGLKNKEGSGGPL